MGDWSCSIKQRVQRPASVLQSETPATTLQRDMNGWVYRPRNSAGDNPVCLLNACEK
jgi:invasion protein IalB